MGTVPKNNYNIQSIKLKIFSFIREFQDQNL